MPVDEPTSSATAPAPPTSATDEEPARPDEGALLLDELRAAIARYVILPSGEALTL